MAERLLRALDGLLAHCDVNPEGETDFERAVIEARLAVAEARGERKVYMAEATREQLIEECAKVAEHAIAYVAVERVGERIRDLKAKP